MRWPEFFGNSQKTAKVAQLHCSLPAFSHQRARPNRMGLQEISFLDLKGSVHGEDRA